MEAEDFSVWLSGIGRLSADQRREAFAALANSEGGREGLGPQGESQASAGGAMGKASKRGRPDALGTSGHERVESLGCPHCAGRELIAWGRSSGLSRFRCKTCGRTFNALTKTPMAHLRKKDRWLEQARAMIEGKSLAKAAELCGVHPTTAFRWRHRFLGSPAADKPRTLNGIVEADETFILESFKGRWSDLPRKARQAGRIAPPSGALSGQHSRSRRPRPQGRDLRRRFAAGRRRFDWRGAGGRRHIRKSSGWRRRPSDRRLRPESQNPLSRRALAGKARPRGAPPAHQQCQRLPRPPQAMDVPFQRRRHKEPSKLSRLAPRPRGLG